MTKSLHTYENIFPCLAGKVVAVIGATGFIGSHLVDGLLLSGCQVRAISRTFPGLLSKPSL